MFFQQQLQNQIKKIEEQSPIRIRPNGSRLGGYQMQKQPTFILPKEELPQKPRVKTSIASPRFKINLPTQNLSVLSQSINVGDYSRRKILRNLVNDLKNNPQTLRNTQNFSVTLQSPTGCYFQ